MKIMGMKRNSNSILARRPNRPRLRGGRVAAPAAVGFIVPVAEVSSTVRAIGSKVDRGSDAGFAPAGSSDTVFGIEVFAGDGPGFETMIWCAQARHLMLAARPLILAGSIRYFFPHSSQMTIMQNILIGELCRPYF